MRRATLAAEKAKAIAAAEKAARAYVAAMLANADEDTLENLEPVRP